MGYLGLEVLPAGDIASSRGKTSDRAGLYARSMVRIIWDVDVRVSWFAENAGLESSRVLFDQYVQEGQAAILLPLHGEDDTLAVTID